MTQITQNRIPQGYFSEITMYHMRPPFASTHRWLLRSVKAMLACKLTLVYAQYHQMSDLQSLVASDYEESYEHAELMASFLSQLLPSRPTSPSELMHSKEEYADKALLLFQIGKTNYRTFVDMFQEISLFEGRRKPLKAADLKLYLRTMNKITDLYISLLQEYLNKNNN